MTEASGKQNVKIKRALLSVSNKAGLIEFAEKLVDRDIEILSTGGTAKALEGAGIAVIDVSEHTGFPEMMGGRLKTLHPKVHGGLLAVRDDPEHQAAAEEHGIPPIDLLVVNLYPFEQTVSNGGSFDECIENIDIGGPAMIRAAAKNHAAVTVVVDTSDYEVIIADLEQYAGAVSADLRRSLAAKAYARTAAYDAAISNWFAAEIKDEAPAHHFRKAGVLRDVDDGYAGAFERLGGAAGRENLDVAVSEFLGELDQASLVRDGDEGAFDLHVLLAGGFGHSRSHWFKARACRRRGPPNQTGRSGPWSTANCPTG